LNYSFSIEYAGARQEQWQNVGTNSTVVFQTVNVTVQLQDSLGNLLGNGDKVQYYAGSWRDLGTTTNGQVSKELLPLNYSFSMSYAGARQEKWQDVSANQTVLFRTGQVHSISGACTQYYAGSWRAFTQDMELLPLSYSFHFNDGTGDTWFTPVAGMTNNIH